MSRNCFVVCVGTGYNVSSSTIIPRQLAYSKMAKLVISGLEYTVIDTSLSLHVLKPIRWVNIMQLGIMQDNTDLSNDHVTVSKKVHEYYSLHVDHHCSPNIMSHDIDRLIKKMLKNVLQDMMVNILYMVMVLCVMYWRLYIM